MRLSLQPPTLPATCDINKDVPCALDLRPLDQLPYCHAPPTSRPGHCRRSDAALPGADLAARCVPGAGPRAATTGWAQVGHQVGLGRYCNQSALAYDGAKQPCTIWDGQTAVYPPSGESPLYVTTRVTTEQPLLPRKRACARARTRARPYMHDCARAHVPASKVLVPMWFGCSSACDSSALQCAKSYAGMIVFVCLCVCVCVCGGG